MATFKVGQTADGRLTLSFFRKESMPDGSIANTMTCHHIFTIEAAEQIVKRFGEEATIIMSPAVDVMDTEVEEIEDSDL